jgi:hypothetical protein
VLREKSPLTGLHVVLTRRKSVAAAQIGPARPARARDLGMGCGQIQLLCGPQLVTTEGNPGHAAPLSARPGRVVPGVDSHHCHPAGPGSSASCRSDRPAAGFRGGAGAGTIGISGHKWGPDAGSAEGSTGIGRP